MKIESVKYVFKKIPLERSFLTASSGVSNSNGLFVKVTTDDGITGYGCGYPTSMTNENPRDALFMSEVFEKELIGINPLRIEKIDAMFDSKTYGNHSVKSAFNMALWDIYGKHYNAPLYLLLGYDKPKIQTSVTLGLNDEDIVLKDAKFWSRKKFTNFKIKLGPDAESNIRLMKAIRGALGHEVCLRCDANGAMSLKEALRFANGVKDLDIEFIEQPVQSFEDMVEITSSSPVRTMGDEIIKDIHDLSRLLMREAFHIANIKINRFGGLTKGLKMIAMAQAHEVPCMMGCMSENALSIAASLHLALAFSNVKYADLDTYLYLKYQPAKGISIKKGYLRPSSSPGLGIEVEKKIFKN